MNHMSLRSLEVNDNKQFPTVFDKIRGFHRIRITAPIQLGEFKAEAGEIIYIDSNGTLHKAEK